MALAIDYNGLVNKTLSILQKGLGTGKTIDTQASSGNSNFPHIYIMRPAGRERTDAGIGGQAEEIVVITLEITTYQGKTSVNTQKQTEEEAYNLLNSIRQVVQNNRNERWENFAGVHDVWSGLYQPVEAMKGYFKLQTQINFMIMETEVEDD